MRSHPITTSYTCLSCGHEFDVTAQPIIPARTYGLPENCYPSEGGECEPEQCPNCKTDVDCNAVAELIADGHYYYKEDPE